MIPDRNPFVDAEGRARVLAGASIYSGSTRFAEMAGRLGFDAVWIDMEHACAGLAEAEAMCVAAEAGGAIPLVRTMGSERDHIMRALEIGGKIIVAPMVNNVDIARRVVQFGKYPPVGRRGFYRSSRGLRFGEDPNWLTNANLNTVLMPQIETLEAVSNLDAILAVEGVDGILVGPGDLSMDMGIPGDYENPELLHTVCDGLRRARKAGKHAGVLTGLDAVIRRVLEAGADLIIMASDTPAVAKAWSAALAGFRLIAGDQSA